jgi:hypothetical protein
MSKDYRKQLGFTNGGKLKDFFTAKDITMINWDLVEAYNDRLINAYHKVNATLPVPYTNPIADLVTNAYQAIRTNDILQTLNNHGRAREDVYYSWMHGYLTAQIFTPTIEAKLGLTLEQNGADDLSKPETFARQSDPDLVDHAKKTFVEVQAGFKGGKVDIKRSKVKCPNQDYTYYIVCIDWFNGRYCSLDARKLLALPDSEWYANAQWEGALCYTVPDDLMISW